MRLLATLKKTKTPVIIVDFIFSIGNGVCAVYIQGNYLGYAPIESFEAVMESK